MICPLKFSTLGENEGTVIESLVACEEEQCAWWVIPHGDKAWGRCAIYHLALKTFDVKVLDSRVKDIIDAKLLDSKIKDL